METEAKHTNQEYYQRINKLRHIIVTAHNDKWIIAVLQRHDEAIRQGHATLGASYAILNHISELAMTDLALSLCKLYYDENSKNTLKKLNSFVRKRFPEIKVPSVSFKDFNKDDFFREKLISMRKQSLAHNDTETSGISVAVADMTMRLDKLTEIFNLLCIKEIDYRVIPYSDFDELKTTINFFNQMGKMLSYTYEDDVEKNDDNKDRELTGENHA